MKWLPCKKKKKKCRSISPEKKQQKKHMVDGDAIDPRESEVC